MKSVAVRLLAKERGLFTAAVIAAVIAGSLGVPVEFILFALTLAGVALFHHHTLQVALIGLAAVAANGANSDNTSGAALRWLGPL